MEIECYPNPAVSVIHIHFENKLQTSTLVVVSDMAGRQLFNTRMTGNEYYLMKSYIGSGPYMLEMLNKKSRGTSKLIFLE
ncbi:MAG: T9SS type A sorting domain-containing protein [Bacteroidetes bacterium]|nr:T9SS type A sorting domain-containing protein [Bacteroidota bacterium]